MNDIEKLALPQEDTAVEYPTPADKLGGALQAVNRVYGEEWNRDFLESARKLHADLPTKTDPEQKLRVFREHFRARCRSLVNLQERLCGNLVRIAMAHRGVIGNDLLGWVRAAVEEYWVARRLGFRGWVALGCDWADLKDRTRGSSVRRRTRTCWVFVPRSRNSRPTSACSGTS